MTWQTFLDTLLLALAGAIPLVVYWFKLWITARIAELKAASAVNSGRIDQHDTLQGIVTTETGAVNAIAGRPQSSVLSTTPSVTLSSDALHETPDRIRVGVVDPHATANAVIEAQAGLPKA